MNRKNRGILIFILLPGACIAIGISSLFLGRYNLEWGQFFIFLKSLFQKNVFVSSQVETIILNIRLPRIIAAFLIGGTLSLTGAAYQGMFRNPMVSPSILGVSSAAGFGASLAILLGLGIFWVQSISFLCGLGAIFVVYVVSLTVGKQHDRYLTLILSGMVVSAIFTALISLIKYMANPYDTLSSIVYWLMGGLSNIGFPDLKYVAFIVLPGSILLSLSGWKLDVLSFGDDEAKSMGIHVERLRVTIIVIATLMTAAVVSISGIIGWIGLLVPHIARMIVGPGNSYLLPASFLVGAAFLMMVDDFSRIVSSMEIPLGITTALIGAPFFIFILLRANKKQHYD